MEQVLQWLEEADFILVGCGKELSPSMHHLPLADQALKKEETAWIADYIFADEMIHGADAEKITGLFINLGQFLKKKGGFLVTTAYDGFCYFSGIYDGFITAPNGNIRKMSCDKHIWDGEAWITQIASAAKEGVDLEKLLPPVCPECGKKLVFHVNGEEWFEKGDEAGQWKAYQNWLSCTMGKKLCMLELGTLPPDRELLSGPFERNLYWNQNAKLIRVGELALPIAQSFGADPFGLYQSDEEKQKQERMNRMERFLLRKESVASFCEKLAAAVKEQQD